MYCASCGVAVAHGLSYCNQCGAKLSGAKVDSGWPEVKPELLVSAMVGLFILGLVAITMLAGVMKGVLEFNSGQIMAFTMLSFLIMLSIEGVCLRLLFRSKRAPKGAGDAVLLKDHATKELDAAKARVLSPPLGSVTEHTTRAFAPIPMSEPQTKEPSRSPNEPNKSFDRDQT
ncbi:MAG TPA: hypothetical protein VMS31_22570 [Pyrinomonadaceae bacterium]|nr:hypothetical protein [Pyrinomonadaceae bacterium]